MDETRRELDTAGRPAWEVEGRSDVVVEAESPDCSLAQKTFGDITITF